MIRKPISNQGQGEVLGANIPVTIIEVNKLNGTVENQYYNGAENAQAPVVTETTVEDLVQLKVALGIINITTINITKDIENIA